MKRAHVNPACTADIARLSEKYPTLDIDIEAARKLIGDDEGSINRIPCDGIEVDDAVRVYRVYISISAAAFTPREGRWRCTLVWMDDGEDCELMLVYDNDIDSYDGAIRALIEARCRVPGPS